ncbi:MAG: ABC transporter ATP-binding protein [Bacteroidales bacterium]|nr:ABC transporter ATP-binding protein [Bacteroidales bacterium]MDY6403739.1 ABC transporter ATP-binding protein [Bacteroidales bacterium]
MDMVKDDDFVLQLKDFSLAFKRDNTWHDVLHSINMSIKRGRITAIVGESGSGKSVTALSVMGLLDKKISKISNGEIVYNLESCKNFKDIREIRGKNVAMIFQDPMTALNPTMKCGKQVDEMLLNHCGKNKQEAKQQTLALFREVDLPDVERIYNSYPFELSGGQRQRVMIAMAVSCNPELLFADEPTTALDVVVQKKILALLADLQKKRNMSVVFISHDLELVENFADDIFVLYKGNIVESGKAKEIFSSPQHPYTKGLIASRPPVDYKPKRLLTVNDFLSGKATNVELQEKKEESVSKDKKVLLEVKNLDIDYIQKKNIFGKPVKINHVIRNMNFDVYDGETLGLIGLSGSGKSTIGKTIVQLLKQSGGDIIYKGKSLSKLSKQERREIKKHIQIVFQDPYSSLNPLKTVGQCITEVMRNFEILNKKEDLKHRTLELLSQVGLDEDFYDRYPHQLSGGQRQRVVLARALCLSPKLIICDESVSALDVSVQAQVLNLLNDLKRRYNFTYIFISHDMRVVKYMSDRIVVLNKDGYQIIESIDKITGDIDSFLQ